MITLVTGGRQRYYSLASETERNGFPSINPVNILRSIATNPRHLDERKTSLHSKSNYQLVTQPRLQLCHFKLMATEIYQP